MFDSVASRYRLTWFWTIWLESSVSALTNCGVDQGLTSPQHCKKQLWDFAFAGADISTEQAGWPYCLNWFIWSTSETVKLWWRGVLVFG
jgi:hypothetical protein